MVKYKSMSLASQVYERLQTDILTEVYKRGEIISENRLTTELGVSRTPIREAMSKLAEEGLIMDSPVGTVVVGVSDDDVDDYYEVRRRIEGMVCGRTAIRVNQETLDALQDIVDMQELYNTKGDTQKLQELDYNFHKIIYASCGSRVLSSLLRGLHKRIMRYRRANLQYMPDRTEDSIAEHRAILEALKIHDAEKAEDLMTEHVENSYRTRLRIREERK
jgi:DNA-binding GntR family transcriptional regulator